MATRKSASRARRRTVRKVKSAVRKTRRTVRRATRKGKVARRKVARRKAAVRRKVARRKSAVRRKVVTRGATARRIAQIKRKDGRPADWPALTPYMTVSDAGASLKFYQAAFGFKINRSGHAQRRRRRHARRHASWRYRHHVRAAGHVERDARAGLERRDRQPVALRVRSRRRCACRACRACGGEGAAAPRGPVLGRSHRGLQGPGRLSLDLRHQRCGVRRHTRRRRAEGSRDGKSAEPDLHAHRRRRHHRPRRRHAGAQGASACRGLWLGRRGIERDRHGARRSPACRRRLPTACSRCSTSSSIWAASSASPGIAPSPMRT